MEAIARVRMTITRPDRDLSRRTVDRSEALRAFEEQASAVEAGLERGHLTFDADLEIDLEEYQHGRPYLGIESGDHGHDVAVEHDLPAVEGSDDLYPCTLRFLPAQSLERARFWIERFFDGDLEAIREPREVTLSTYLHGGDPIDWMLARKTAKKMLAEARREGDTRGALDAIWCFTLGPTNRGFGNRLQWDRSGLFSELEALLAQVDTAGDDPRTNVAVELALAFGEYRMDWQSKPRPRLDVVRESVRSDPCYARRWTLLDALMRIQESRPLEEVRPVLERLEAERESFDLPTRFLLDELAAVYAFREEALRPRSER